VEGLGGGFLGGGGGWRKGGRGEGLRRGMERMERERG